MTFFQRLQTAAKVFRALLTSNLSNPEPWLLEMMGGRQSLSGEHVTPETALRVSAVYACVRVLAETVASLPFQLFERRPGGGKDLATGHSLYPILHDLPNEDMTSFDLRETLMVHLALRGNSYCQKVMWQTGEIIGLVPLHPDRLVMRRLTNGNLEYEYSPGDANPARKFMAQDIWRITGLSSNGLVGYSPITLARETIGLSMAGQRLEAGLFANGIRPSGVYSHPGTLGDEALKRLRVQLSDKYSGADNAGKALLLEEGTTWTQVGLKLVDAQFIELLQLTLADIARIFRVPGVLIGLDDKTSTYASAEQFFLSFVVHTVRPWLVRIEQSVARDLFRPGERKRYFAEFNIDGLLRGDFVARTTGYKAAIETGWLSRNEVRELENWNPAKGLDEFLSPLNLGQQSDRNKSADNQAPADPAPNKQSARLQAILRENCGRLARKEVAAISKAAERLPGQPKFGLWLDSFYDDEVKQFTSALGVDQGFGEHICSEAARTVFEAWPEVPALMQRWEKDRAGELYALTEKL